MKDHHYDDMVLLFKKAIVAGAHRQANNSLIWDCAGNCLNPWVQVHRGRPAHPTSRTWEWSKGRASTLYLEMRLRCNQCAPCLRNRALLWRARMRYEIANAPRTWFGTLTLSPSHHFTCEMLARKDNRDYDDLSDQQKLKARLKHSGSEVTRYLKRLRHHAKAPLRFVCVTELHKEKLIGLPHYHLLIHEQTRNAITHAVLAEHWKWGFERWRLLEPSSRAEWYLCKYLAKSNDDRVRASLRYGGRQNDDQPAASKR